MKNVILNSKIVLGTIAFVSSVGLSGIVTHADTASVNSASTKMGGVNSTLSANTYSLNSKPNNLNVNSSNANVNNNNYSTTNLSSNVSNNNRFNFGNYAVTTNNTSSTSTQNNSGNDTQIEVTNYDFQKYMHVNGDATYDPSTNTVTLTPDLNSQKGHAALNVPVDMNKNFSIKAHVFLGNNPSNKGGADGIAIGFHPGSVNSVGQTGNAFGIGGLPNAMGFKLDTYYNSDGTTSGLSYNPDPKQFNKSGDAFGGFIYSDNNGVVSTYDPGSSDSSADPTEIPAPNGTWGWLTVNYTGANHVMTVNYQNGNYNHTWTADCSKWIGNNQYMAFSVSSSTGGSKNLQQMNFFDITAYVPTSDLSSYQEKINVKYVDEISGNEIAPSQTVTSYDGQNYTTNQVTVNNYTFDKVDPSGSPASGRCTGSNMVVTYEYMPAAEHAVVNYVDSTTGKVVSSDTVNGYYNNKSIYNPTATEQNLAKQGYTIGNSTLPTNDTITFTQNGVVPIYTVSVGHKISSGTPTNNPDNIPNLTKTVTQTISYKYPDGSTAAPNKTITLHYIRTATKDDVTGEVNYSNWQLDPKDESTIPSPVIPGYYASTPDVTISSQNFGNPNNVSNVNTVLYKPNTEQANIEYIDDTTGKVISSSTISGKYQVNSDYPYDSIVNDYLNKGYKLISSDYPSNGSIFNQDGKIGHYQVHLVEITNTYNYRDNPYHLPLTNVIQRRIKFINNDGRSVYPDIIQTITYHRTAVRNNVTGMVTYGPWQASGINEFPEINLPKIAGFNLDKTSIPTEKGNLNNKEEIVKVLVIPDVKDKPVEIHKIVDNLNYQKTRTPKHLVIAKSQMNKRILPFTGEKNVNGNLWGTILLIFAELIGSLGFVKRKK